MNDSVFKVGDMLVDDETGDVGLLTERYDVFEGYFIEDEEIGAIWAWEVFWTGSSTAENGLRRRQNYTEAGLIALVKDGHYMLVKIDEHEDRDDDDT